MEGFEEFADLFVQEGSVEIGKHRFTVRHLAVVHMGIMHKAFEVAWAMLGNDAESQAILAERGADILPAIAAATDLPLDVLRKMKGGVQLALWAAVLEVNDDFFVQYAAHKYGATALLVAKMIDGAGQAQSTTSAPEDIPPAKRIPLADLKSSSARPS